ncbi:MAG: EAL domain-containing protein [Helicobacteraceae bacterium]|nr:EAL domain-containing protein [Helicobacteraceae bacterium]
MPAQTTTCNVLDENDIDEVQITPKEYNDILDYQQEILRMIASHEKSQKILNALCTLAEKLLPNSVASLMLVDDSTSLMSVVAAPSIPKVGHDALANLQPGPYGGSCGNAVFHNDAQFVTDTFTDLRWKDIRHIAQDFNLCACWSMPVRDEAKNAIGSFALSSFEHRTPAPFHKKLLQTAAAIVNVVLKNRANEKRLELFYNAMENASQGIILTNSKNKIIEVNKAFEDIYGLSESDVLGKDPNVISSKKYAKSFYKKMWSDLKEKSSWNGEITNMAKDGSLVHQWTNITALYDEDSNDHNYLGIFTDMSELKKTQQKLEEMAYIDQLCGLYNKTKLEKLLKVDSHKTLILLNINNFSYINTAYGFELGDKLLVKVAQLLKTNFEAEYTFRINSDEFALLFDSKIEINETIDTINNFFYDNVIELDNINIHISFSYGVAYGDKNILRNSALALKQAKESGKNSVHIFNKDSDSIDHSSREKFISSNNLLHLAIKEDRVVPYFQGIKNNKTDEITKFEALVRIKEGSKIVSPFEFLETAKLSGMLPEITKIMIDKSFKIMSKNSYTFSINITQDDLSKNYLIAYLDTKAKEYKVDPSRVILEILEGVSTSAKTNHLEQLNSFKKSGYSIAIDDFGSEYSNFERILDLDIDFLKIDAQYIKDIDTNKKSYEITRAIAFFAQNANIPCIAEFVHNEAVQNIIEELDITFSQGYLFSEPSPYPIAK